VAKVCPILVAASMIAQALRSAIRSEVPGPFGPVVRAAEEQANQLSGECLGPVCALFEFCNQVKDLG